MFAAIGDVAMGADGSVYVLDRKAVEVREFDAEGTFVRRIGGRGQGPGEFIGPLMLAAAPDGRLLVADRALGRIEVFSRSGAHLATWSGLQRMEAPLVVGQDGTVYYRQRGRVRFSEASKESGGGALRYVASDSGIRPPSTIRLRSDGSVIDTVPALDLPDLDSYIELPGNPPRRIYAGLVYHPYAWWLWTPQGTMLSGISDRYAIDIHRPAPGTASWSSRDSTIRLERDIPRVALRPEEQVVIQKRIDKPEPMTPGARWQPQRTAPVEKPVYHRVFAALDGRIWVALHVPSTERRISQPRESVQWLEETRLLDIFEPDGRYVGQVRGPAGGQIMAIDGDRVASVVTDSLGVEMVRIFRVSWK